MMRIILLFLIISIFPATADIYGQEDYIWPLKIAPDLSSRFCDYRAGHFHAGLDLRTNGKDGYRIYAVDNGYIYRISTAHNGYGKALYLRLQNGKIVVYGHLSSFGEALDDFVRKKQMAENKYRQNIIFMPGQYPVAKGQNIGLSGSSGAGAPHLHFEMRSPNNFPINPLKSGFAIEDNVPPVFDRLAIRHYGDKFGPGNPCEIEFPEITPGETGNLYIVKDTISTTGEIALAISGGDRVDGKQFIYGYYGLRLFVDDSLAFEMVADSITYETTDQLDYIRDTELSAIAGKPGNRDNDENVFFKLYAPPGADQYFWKGFGDNAGIIKPSILPGGTRKAEIRAWDSSGNNSILRFFIRTPELPAPAPDFISYYKFEDTIEVDFLTYQEISRVETQFRNSAAEPYQDIKANSASKTWRNYGQIAYLNTMQILAPYKRDDYRFRFSAADGRKSPWIYFKDFAGLSKLELTGSPDHLRIDYYPDSIYSNLAISFSTETTVFEFEMYQRGIGVFSIDIKDRILTGVANIRIKKGSLFLVDTLVTLFPVYPDMESDIYSINSTLKIKFEEGAAFYPVYVVPYESERAVIFGNDAIVFNVYPLYLVSKNPIGYKFDITGLNLSSLKTGAYGFVERTQKWGFIEKASGNSIEFMGLGLGRIALLEDNDSPIIQSIRPRGRIKSRRPNISCVINDRISGIDLEDGLEMKIDGIWIPAEYDLDTKKFQYTVQNDLKPGSHKIEINIKDNQGNTTSKTSYFTIL